MPGTGAASLAEGFAAMVAATGEIADEDPIFDDKGVNSAGHEIIVQFRCCAEMEEINADLSSIAIGDGTKQAYLHMIMLNLEDER
ncbi:MAG TPA: hypothetical protein VIL30_15705 [Ramlibacter sp.]